MCPKHLLLRELRHFYMGYLLQTFKNVKNNHVGSNIDVSDWVSMIKGCEFSSTIEKARKGSLNYEKTKVSLPCINYQFYFRDYKKNDNIISSTGLLYFDIDNPSFTLNSIDISKVFLAHKSFGGNGFTIVVRVKSMDKDNYRYYFQEISKDLGIDDLVDYNAAKQVQTNVLSFDSNVYYNTNSKEYYFYPPPPSNNKKRRREKHIGGDGGYFQKTSLSFSNSEMMDFEDKDYIVDWGNIKFVRCSIPYKKLGRGKRNNMLLSFANNFVYLNPNAPKKSLRTILNTVNEKGCSPKVSSSQLDRVVESVWKYKLDGSLKPIYDKNRSIIFKKDSDLTVEEKQKIVGKEIKKYWKGKSIDKIRDIINNWDFNKLGKISGQKIYKNFPISKKTVEKYYSEVKSDIKFLNEKYKK